MNRAESGRAVIWALVPVKRLSQGKSRLAALPAAQKADLQQALLSDVLAALTGSAELDGVAVLTRDPSVASLARKFGAETIEALPDAMGLNQALADGVAQLRVRGADFVLVVPADVPLIDIREVDALAAQARLSPSTFVIPNRDGTGTNGLLVGLDPLPAFAFGQDSFQRHLKQGGPHRVVPWPAGSLALDVDTPSDLAVLQETVSNGVSAPSAKHVKAWMKTYRGGAKARDE